MLAGVTLHGRERELERLRELLRRDRARIVLTGEPGIGKTTLWEAAIAAARERATRVLSARPAGDDSHAPYAAMTDLCDGLDLAGLEAPQRRALEAVVLRADSATPQPHAVSVGLLSALRAQAAEAPLLIAIDDVQWLDPPSARVLAFAARRLGDERVGFVLARRPGAPSELERVLERRALERLDVGPLGPGAIRGLLSERLGLTVRRQLLTRLVASTLGNPWLGLEVGRALKEQPDRELGEDLPVPDGIEELLDTPTAQWPDGACRLLLAVALSPDLRLSALSAIATPSEIEAAIDARLLCLDGERVRAAHPLLAAGVKQRSAASKRRALHRALAVADPERHTLHLASAAVCPDPELAAAAAAAATAAGEAAARGARREAVRFAEHALRLTPAASPERPERVLALAGHLALAGEPQRLADLLTPDLDALPPGALRTRAWLLLSDAGCRQFDAALAECEADPYVLARKAGHTARIAAAEALALEALSSAGPDAEHYARYQLAFARALRGRPIEELATAHAASSIAESPERVLALRLVWRGEPDRARAIVTRLLTLADERGEQYSYVLLRAQLCELELRTGEWAAASRRLEEWAGTSDGELLRFPSYERCHALLAAGRGRADEAERWAAQAIAAARAGWEELEALRARGIAALLGHEPARAANSLRAVWRHTVRNDVDEPGAFPVAPELVEALLELGEDDEAQAVVVRLRELADRQQHPWAHASATRCAAVLRLADAYDEQAAGELADAAAAYQTLGLPFDAARCRLSLGRAQRRHKKWGAARDSLQHAAAAFDTLGSGGWAEQARCDLSRVGARRPRANGELSPSERRVVELAAEGRANKEIARVLHVTVHTVEAHLSRAYAKLGVHSRGQLAARIAAR